MALFLLTYSTYILYKLDMWLKYLITIFIILFTLKSQAYEIYTVKKGDTLISIAHKLGIKAKLIKQANPKVNWLKIRPNDKINIPTQDCIDKFNGIEAVLNEAQNKPNKPKERTNKTSRQVRLYTIKKGDSLYKIAHNLHYSISALKSANPKIAWKDIKPGEKIVLPLNHTTPKAIPKPGEIGDGYYIVARGDTLRSIASRFGLSLKKLQELNPNLDKIIRPGDVVVIPKELTEKIKVCEKENLFIPPKYLIYSDIYKVKKGDTLWEIAKKFNTDVDIVRTLNDISGNNIHVGQVLFVPSKNIKEAQRLKLKYSILNEERHALIKYAERFIGAPYKFGGDSLRHGIDCSAFVKKIYEKFKVYLPRTAEGQYREAGVFVPSSRLQPGDLLFFHTLDYAKATHVAIYIGKGRFIHAAGRRSGVRISRFTKYYWKRFIGAKRILRINNVNYAYIRNRSRKHNHSVRVN